MFKAIKGLIKKETRENTINHIEMVFKSNDSIIQQIHDEFYSEVDKLLTEAKISVSEATELHDIISKANRLRLLGFGATKECREAEAEESRLRQAAQINASKKTLTEAINYFSFKYPQYKFITEESVKKICAKYNLIYSTIDKYIGTVPDSNIKQMEDFKIDEDDCCLEEIMSSMYERRTHVKYISSVQLRIEKEQKEIEQQKLRELSMEKGYNHLSHISYPTYSISSRYCEINKCPNEIVAPVSDFNTKGMELSGFKLTEVHIPDPVVLKPVFFGGEKHYLIVCAWGLEGSDELVINQKMN